MARVRTGIPPTSPSYVPAHQADNGCGLRGDWVGAGEPALGDRGHTGGCGISGTGILPADPCGAEWATVFGAEYQNDEMGGRGTVPLYGEVRPAGDAAVKRLALPA